MKICAFTGHRPKSFSFGDNENHPDCIQLKQVLRNQIERLYFEGFTHFITGCAMGVDIWAGEIVLDLMQRHANMELICVIPFQGQESQWNKKDRKRIPI